MDFEIIGAVASVEVIAAGRQIRDLDWLNRAYGPGRWRKLKGVAVVRLLEGGEPFKAEIHWYESPEVGQHDFKIKKRLE